MFDLISQDTLVPCQSLLGDQLLLWLPVPAGHTPWGAAVRAQGMGLLLPMGDAGCVSGSWCQTTADLNVGGIWGVNQEMGTPSLSLLLAINLSFNKNKIS